MLLLIHIIQTYYICSMVSAFIIRLNRVLSTKKNVNIRARTVARYWQLDGNSNGQWWRWQSSSASMALLWYRPSVIRFWTWSVQFQADDQCNSFIATIGINFTQSLEVSIAINTFITSMLSHFQLKYTAYNCIHLLLNHNDRHKRTCRDRKHSFQLRSNYKYT